MVNLVLLGYGSIGSTLFAYLPELQITLQKVVIICDEQIDPTKHISNQNDKGVKGYIKFPFEFEVIQLRITQQNYEKTLQTYTTRGDILVELIHEVKTIALMRWCSNHDVRFVNTACYEWPELDPDTPLSVQMKDVTDCKKILSDSIATQCVMCGANPGLVSQFTARALRDLWTRIRPDEPYPKSDSLAAQQLQIYNVDVTEDDQQDGIASWEGDYEKEFYCSWSPYSFYYENVLQMEAFLDDCRGPIVFDREDIPEKFRYARSYAPGSGEYVGNCVQHEEIYSIGNFLTDKTVGYSPMTRFVYRPCVPSQLSLKATASEEDFETKKLVVLGKELHGDDIIGSLVRSKTHAQWVGAIISADFARRFNPHLNASDWFVTIGVFVALKFAYDNPNAGCFFPEDLDVDYVLSMLQEKGWIPELVSTACDEIASQEDLGFPYNLPQEFFGKTYESKREPESKPHASTNACIIQKQKRKAPPGGLPAGKRKKEGNFEASKKT